MASATEYPKNLREAIHYFADERRAFEFVVLMRWPDGITCPRCDCGRVSFISTRKTWKCLGCRKQFSVRVGTIFEGSPLPFSTWLPAVWLIANSKNGISSHELGRAMGITQKTAWFMLHRIRKGMADGTVGLMAGVVEVDETYVGGAAKFMHKDRHQYMVTGRGGVDKIAIQGLRERGGKMRATVLGGTSAADVEHNIYKYVSLGTKVYTDKFAGYKGLSANFVHGTVDHGKREFVRGDIHVNGVENFWTLFKRAWRGTYTHMNHEHAHRYLDERLFSFNLRGLNDLERCQAVLGQVTGRRMTWNQLTGVSE